MLTVHLLCNMALHHCDIIVVAVQYGRQSLELVLKSILGTEKSLVSSEDYPQEFFDGT